jgi:microcystin-dependent protein
MPIESASYINQLNTSYPASTDGVQEGDDHIRLVKSVLKSTFPNITGPVTVSQNELNNIVPIGVITMWYGATNALPPGWALCNGQTVQKSDASGPITTPDLRNRFVVGAGSTYAVNATGGGTSYTFTMQAAGGHTHTASTGSAGSHNHGGVTGDTALSINQIPSHTHTYQRAASLSFTPTFISSYGYDGQTNANLATGINSDFPQTGAAGSSAAHNHGISSDGSHTHTVTVDSVAAHSHTIDAATIIPPYYALAYIMKY